MLRTKVCTTNVCAQTLLMYQSLDEHKTTKYQRFRARVEKDGLGEVHEALAARSAKEFGPF